MRKSLLVINEKQLFWRIFIDNSDKTSFHYILKV